MAELQNLSPALKSWLDNVLVPAMVKRWIAEHQDGRQPPPSSSVAYTNGEDRHAQRVTGCDLSS
jgi:hypothetical protein